MRVVVADWESYYDSKTFTLSKMTTESYVRDPRFEAHGCAIKWQHNIPARWYDQNEIRHIMAEEDWSDVFMIHHHAQFDSLIESHHYNCHPKMIGCTLSMARLLLGNHLSVSLDSVRKHFGIPLKTTPYGLFDGKHWSELDAATRQLVGEGACDEVESIFKIFGLLLKDFPPEELEVVDTTIKMFSEPVLQADTALLGKVWEAEALRKEERLIELNVDPTELASADKFTTLLEAEGVEIEYKPGKNKPIPCFAKTDDFMRGLLEHPNERIRTLAEARLGEKSTFLQTRAETLGWKASRGALPVYLFYAGAGTLRPSGGDKDNWLNFKRGSDIRKAIMAPPGFLLGPVDSSQIECRCLHFLAGGADEPVIQKFRAHEDPYTDLASLFYKETIYKPKGDDPRRAEMEAKRGMGKQGRLMCFGPDTLVLTHSGIKPIVRVRKDDFLWDGVEWVTHQGLVFQDEQNVVNLAGVAVTSEHQILCGTYGWQPAAACLRDANILSRALESGSANLPSRVMNSARAEESLTSWFNVRAVLPNTPCIYPTYIAKRVRDATRALKKRLVTGSRNIMAMLTYALTSHIAVDCSIASPSFTIGVAPTVKTNGTAAAELKFGISGAAKVVGVNFSHISSRFRAGISPSLKLIVRTIRQGIVPAICNSLRARNRCVIDEASSSSKTRLPTYDLSFSGPRNRFTILSAQGPLIVHNCGYGAAGKQFKATAKNGLYGPPVDISIEDANDFVALYRAENPSICLRPNGYWSQADRMIARLAGGPPVSWGPLEVRDHKIYLPNGCYLNYESLEFHRPDADEEVRDFERDGYWRMRTKRGWKKMWGSKLTQNICEAVSRVIVTQAMIRITRLGYRVLNHPYDELLCLIPDDGHAEEHLERCRVEMVREVPWLPGLPLDCEAHLNQRYVK